MLARPKHLAQVIGVLLVAGYSSWSVASSYFVSAGGSDTGSGSQQEPWRTLAKAAQVMQPGDTTYVLPGFFDERVTTVRGGTSTNARVRFVANGDAVVRGFSIKHPYTTVEGFQITGHSSPSRMVGYVEILDNGDFFELQNNQIRDGAYIVRDDLHFIDKSPDRDCIVSAKGGFSNAGFRAGMKVSILLGDRVVSPLNKDKEYVVYQVGETNLTLDFGQEVIPEGPTTAFLSGAMNYGLVVTLGAAGGICRSNHFSNLAYDAALIGGTSNIFEHNIFERCNGWEALHFQGVGNVFRRNIVKNSPPSTYSNLSPDAFETAVGSTTHQFVFEENYVEGFDGMLGVLRNGSFTNMGDVIFRNNVFVGGGAFIVKIPNVAFINNTFLRVAETNTLVVQAFPHAIEFEGSTSQSAEGGVVINNIFVGCGSSRDQNKHGWFSFANVVNHFSTCNFVSGAAPLYLSKSGFEAEPTDFNGGDPGFVDPNSPLGPDGVPFTADDGLRLRQDSKLRNRGLGGTDAGAYGKPPPPTLMPRFTAGGITELRWRSYNQGFRVQSKLGLDDQWVDVAESPILQGGFWSQQFSNGPWSRFFRLSK
jgi:hypothetical protein